MSEIIRVKYEKREEVKYVGHLDTMRTFTRCLKRTQLPLTFSKGFNPRVQLSFALPLGVGITSESEYFDLMIENKINTDFFMAEFNSTLPEGFRVVAAWYPEDTKKSLMSLVKEAIYEITFQEEMDFTRIKELLEKDEILVEKKTDKKVTTQNIKEGILDFSFRGNVGTIHVTAGSSNNVNPMTILEAVNQYVQPVQNYEIHRKALLLAE